MGGDSDNHCGRHKGRLKRLPDAFYRGRSYVHWTMTMESRQGGWLTAAHYDSFRWVMFHALARGHLCCPCFCLMPDHAHFLWVGLNERADQKAGVTCLRREWNRLLKPVRLERQPYDSVLREDDRRRDSFADLCGYILRNPVRAGLCSLWQDWPFSGAAFPGYPYLDPRKDYFWENFWTAYQRQGG